MSRCILIYGQPAAGKSFSLRSLDPSTTVIIDADLKGALPWRGSRQQYSKENRNFFSVSSLDKIYNTVRTVGESKDWANIRTLVIDGFNNAMMSEVLFYDETNSTKNKFEKYDEVARKTVRIIDAAQKMRDDLTVVFTAHVETADPYVTGDVDKVFTPGKYLKDKIKVESKFNYVFYAKTEEEEFFFETAPFKSTARSPHECFSSRIPNDIKAAIETIIKYEEGVTEND